MQQLLRGYRAILPDMYASGLTPVISWVNKPVVSPSKPKFSIAPLWWFSTIILGPAQTKYNK